MNPDSTLLIPKPIFLANMTAASLSGFFMNLLLLYLISKRTPKEMRSYARIMRIHCLSDIVYDGIQCFAGVHAHPLGGKVYMMLQGFQTNVSLEWNHYIFSFYFWSLLFSIALLPIDFFFRYLSVCKNKDLTGFQLYAMVFFAYFITWLHAFPNSYVFLESGPSPSSIEFTKELQSFPDWKNNVPSYSVTVLGSTKALSNFMFILLLNSFSYGVILYTYIKIGQALKKNASTANNPKAAEINKQVSRILALQALLPLIVICLPVVVTVIFALTHTDLPHFGAYSSFIYVWLAAAKPTATILIIPRYRVFVRSRLCGQWQIGDTSVANTTGNKTDTKISDSVTDVVDSTDNHYF